MGPEAGIVRRGYFCHIPMLAQCPLGSSSELRCAWGQYRFQRGTYSMFSGVLGNRSLLQTDEEGVEVSQGSILQDEGQLFEGVKF